MTHLLQPFAPTRLAMAVLLLAAITASGCAYGLPPATQIPRPEIQPGATPQYSWSVPDYTVSYYWYKVNKFDITVKATGYFPSPWTDDSDARWKLDFHTLPAKGDDPVPGGYLGVLRTYVDASGHSVTEIVPTVPVEALDEGMYGVIENGVQTDPADAKKIIAIRPTLHILMVKDHKIDPFFNLPIKLNPDMPSEMTPAPQPGEVKTSQHGTTLNMTNPGGTTEQKPLETHEPAMP